MTLISHSVLSDADKRIWSWIAAKQNYKVKVPHIGHILTHTGVKPNPEKSQRHSWYVTSSQRKIGAAIRWIHKLSAQFLPYLSEVCKPLRHLCKNGIVWAWEFQQENAFNIAKRLVILEPVLGYYDVTKAVVIQCDASARKLHCFKTVNLLLLLLPQWQKHSYTMLS